MVGAFAVATLLAELPGAANTGTALTFGQIAFAAALVYVLVDSLRRGPRRSRAPSPRSSSRRRAPATSCSRYSS